MADDPWWSCTFAARPTPAFGSVPKTPRRKRLETEDVVRRLVTADSGIEKRCERDLRGGDIHVSLGSVAHAIGPDQLIVPGKATVLACPCGNDAARFGLHSLKKEMVIWVNG